MHRPCTFFCALVFCASSAFSQTTIPAARDMTAARAWQPLGAMPGAGPEVWQIRETVADADRLYAATSAGVIVSSDQGRTWELRESPPAPWSWMSIACSPADPDLLLFCTWGGGMYRSVDAGRSWQRPAAPPDERNLWLPAFAPSDASRVYVVSEDGVWRSLDAGMSFTRIFSGIIAQGGFGNDLAIDASDARHVYFVAVPLGLFETVDGGDHWQQKSFPAGVRWPSFALDPRDGSRLLLGDTDVYLSDDGGDSFRLLLEQDSVVDALAFDPLDAQRLFASLRTEGLSVSKNGGADFSVVDDLGLERAGGLPRAIVPSASHAGLLLLGDTGGIFRSTDRGDTFVRSNAGLENHASVQGLVVDPFDANHLVAATGGSAFVSFDAGSTWSEAAGPTHFFGVDLEVDAVIPGRCYRPTWDAKLWRSDDGGRTFFIAGADPGLCWKMAVHPTVGGRLFAAGAGLLRSDDGGASFAAVDLPRQWCWTVAISPVDPDLMYCVVDPIMYRSEDGGRTWFAADVSPGSIVREIIADPVVAGRAYAAAPLAGLYRTDDRGRTWQRVSTSLDLADTAIIVPSQPECLFAADANERVLLSLDAGDSARDASRGVRTRLTVFAQSATRLYAGSSGSGVMTWR